jgi:hypothetical protein
MYMKYTSDNGQYKIKEFVPLYCCHRPSKNNVGIEVIMVVTTESTIFSDVMPCSLEVVQHFGGTYALYLQGQKVS